MGKFHGNRMGRLLSLATVALLGAMIVSAQARAGEADVVEAEAVREQARTYRFDVTVRHGDEGWDHYADAFEVVAPDGTILGTRTLYHPHVDEQPFTRSLTGVAIPESVTEVTVRARDSVHGFGGATVSVTLPKH